MPNENLAVFLNFHLTLHPTCKEEKQGTDSLDKCFSLVFGNTSWLGNNMYFYGYTMVHLILCETARPRVSKFKTNT